MSSLEFNETDFPEYDPTPYDGGYDMNATYGKPLPPSEKICYPRAGEHQKPSSPIAQDLIDQIEKPIQQIESTPPTPRFTDNNISEKPDLDIPIELNLGKELPQFGNDYVPKSNGYNNLSEEIGEYDYEGEENGYTLGQVPLPPSEYVEPCASLFGYWPCLMKDYKRNALQQCCIDKGYGNGWRKAEDYFFGSSYPYGETRDDYVNRVDYNYGYEKHYMEKPTYVQENYNQHSQKMSSRVDVHYGYDKHYMEQPTQEYYNPDLQQLSTHVDVNYGYENHYMEHPTHVQEHYNPVSHKLSTHVDIDYGYEKHYMEQPAYVQEQYDSQKLSTLVDINYGYEKHYMEQPAYVQEQYDSQKLSTYVDINYGYEKHYREQPSIVPEEYSLQLRKQAEDNYVYDKHYKEPSSYVQEDLWPEKLSNQVEQNYGCDKHYARHHVDEDYVPDLESQNMYRQLNIFQGYDKHDVEQTTHVYEDCNLQFHPQNLSSQEDFNYGCEKSYKEQPSYVQEDYKPQLWSQMLSYSYYEA